MEGDTPLHSEFNRYVWDVIDKFFMDDPYSLTAHTIQSYNDFVKIKIPALIQQKNPIQLFKEPFESTNEYKYVINVFIGGKNGNQIYAGKPVIVTKDPTTNEQSVRPLTPAEARLNELTYETDLYVDVVIEYYYKENMNEQSVLIERTFPKVLLCKLPIMLHSELCVLRNMSDTFLTDVGECPYERGGYFIIQGKEKVIVSQERLSNNKLLITQNKDDPKYFTYSADVRCSSEELNQPPEIVALRWNEKQQCIRVFNNYFRITDGIPLFLLFRAFGIESDKDIITCILGEEYSEEYESYMLPLRGCAQDASGIYHQKEAMQYIASLTKGAMLARQQSRNNDSHALIGEEAIDSLLYILQYYVFTHIQRGGVYHPEENLPNFKEKALYLGHVTKKLLEAMHGIIEFSDRDRFDIKRVELPGSLMYSWFRQNYEKFTNSVRVKIDSLIHYGGNAYKEMKVSTVVTSSNVHKVFDSNMIYDEIIRCLRGKCKGQGSASAQGIVQELSRVCFLSSLSHLRRMHLEISAETAKITDFRKVHGSHWGVICPVESPEGSNIGLTKHFAIMSTVSQKINSFVIIQYLQDLEMMETYYINPKEINSYFKIFLNGRWVGVHDDPIKIHHSLRLLRRNGYLSPFMSLYLNMGQKELLIRTDEGRLMRPVFIVEKGKLLIDERIRKHPNYLREVNWQMMVSGKVAKDEQYSYQRNEYKDDINFKALQRDFEKNTTVIEYLDTEETNGSLLATHQSELLHSKSPYTHCEIHPSSLLGVMGLMIPFLEFNQAPRNILSCAQTKSSTSIYLSNFNKRMDLTSNVLNYGQKPLVSSKYVNYILREKMVYGTNVIFAIMAYTGFNQEDAFILNKSALKRGLCSSTYYGTYTFKEDVVTKFKSNKLVGNPNLIENVELNVQKDYSYLDVHGIVKVGTYVKENDVLIGAYSVARDGKKRDQSVSVKKGLFGIVDKVYVSNNSKGYRVVKVTIRQIRIPEFGDKFSSRHGQKGTVGILLEEEDMPFTKDGLIPDVIVNPHQIPGRMTVAHLLEPILGRLACSIGCNMEGTAFSSASNPMISLSKRLLEYGFEKSGCDILYNGFDGTQMQADIFTGPINYMRLKHMPTDKINARARGPNILLTRQPQTGKSNEGGLRIGEMERDSIISHGIAEFLKESMYDRSDAYEYIIDDDSGYIAPVKETTNPNKVHAPYTFKLLTQEVQTMGIGMKLYSTPHPTSK